MFSAIKTPNEEFTLKTKVGDRGTYETKDGKTFQSYSRSPYGLAYDAYLQGATKVDPFAATVAEVARSSSAKRK